MQLREAQARDAESGLREFTSRATQMVLVRIESGEFLMGSPDSDPDAKPSEKPQHRVRITRPFYLGKYPVTVGQFGTFVRATGYRTELERRGKSGYWFNPDFGQTDQHPVVNVSWNDAVAFCEWLGREDRQVYRLPTEAEWEYACRGGSTTRYSFGDDERALGQYAWPPKDSESTHVVGARKPNGFGLFDMHGNVQEWCWDWQEKDYYTHSPLDDPLGPNQGEFRAQRSGGWLMAPRSYRCAARLGAPPHFVINYLGFRVARVESFSGGGGKPPRGESKRIYNFLCRNCGNPTVRYLGQPCDVCGVSLTEKDIVPGLEDMPTEFDTTTLGILTLSALGDVMDDQRLQQKERQAQERMEAQAREAERNRRKLEQKAAELRDQVSRMEAELRQKEAEVRRAENELRRKTT
jgi:formylglycine-generating enzyme required for sulfatase activity